MEVDLAYPQPPRTNDYGSAQPIVKRGTLAADVFATLEHMEVDLFSEDELRRVLEIEEGARGLQAEAGCGPSTAVILHTRVEKLASGAEVGCWLTLSGSVWGDALYWNVHATGAEYGQACASQEQRDRLLSMLRAAGGGTVEVRDHPTPVPTDAELAMMANY